VIISENVSKSILPAHNTQVSYPFPIHGRDHSEQKGKQLCDESINIILKRLALAVTVLAQTPYKDNYSKKRKLNPENLKTKDLLYLTGDEKLKQKNYKIMLAQNIRQFSTNKNYQLTKTIFFEMDKGSEIIHNLIMSKSMHCVIEIHIHVNKFKWLIESFHK
jgi:hypothetical protein